MPDKPSSFLMYLSAKVRPVSLRSTMRTLPKAPLPTTRSSRKWFRFTVWGSAVLVLACWLQAWQVQIKCGRGRDHDARLQQLESSQSSLLRTHLGR